MNKLRATVIKHGPLTNKEAQVLRYLCEGCTRPEIAFTKLFRSVSTINRHVEKIASKLEATCTAEIVATAVAAGLVKITIHDDHNSFARCLIAIVMLNVTYGHIDMRRGPASPRPTRTVRVATRIHQSQAKFT